MDRLVRFDDRAIQFQLERDVLACQYRFGFGSVRFIARYLYKSRLMRKCHSVDPDSFEMRVRSILLKYGDPYWQYRATPKVPVPVSSNPWLEILAEHGKPRIDEEDEDEDIMDEDDNDDKDYYTEEESEEDLEFLRSCFDTDYNVKKKIDPDTGAGAGAGADADTDTDAADAVAVTADAAVAVTADDAVADADTAVSIVANVGMLLQGQDAHPPMFKDLVGMDAVAALKAGFFNLPFNMSRILLHGPPGCPITNIAHSIVNETPHVSFYQSSGADPDELIELFSKASATTTPSVVFVHDIDACRLLDVLMCMDMVRRPGSVLVVGATTRRHAINPGLMGFGKFDCEIALAIPDENNPRVHILSVLARDMEKLTISTNQVLPPHSHPK